MLHEESDPSTILAPAAPRHGRALRRRKGTVALSVHMIARREIFLCGRCVRSEVDPFGYQRTPVGSICGPLAELGRRSSGADVAGWLNATVPSEFVEEMGPGVWQLPIHGLGPIDDEPFVSVTEDILRHALTSDPDVEYCVAAPSCLQDVIHRERGFPICAYHDEQMVTWDTLTA